MESSYVNPPKHIRVYDLKKKLLRQHKISDDCTENQMNTFISNARNVT